MLKLVTIEGEQALLNEIANLYQQVWNTEDNSIRERVMRHAGYEGFRGFAALSDKGEVAGYAYGYSSLPEQYYHGLLSKEFNSAEYDEWLTDSFEFVEMAVHPSFRNQGLAKKLVNILVDAAAHHTAVLTTQHDNEPARNLYESLGWCVLKDCFYPNGEENPYIIMGKKLT